MNVLESLDECIDANIYDTVDFIASVFKKMQFDGTMHSLLIAVHTAPLLANDTILEAAGVTKPKMISELVAAAGKLTVLDGSGNIAQIGMNLPDFISRAYRFGARRMDADGKPTANDPSNTVALQFWIDNALKKYGVDEVKRFLSGFDEDESAWAPFHTGMIMMITDGEWKAKFIKLYARDLKWSAESDLYIDAKLELEGTTGLATSTFFIPANSKHKQEHKEFLKYLVSNKSMLDFTLTFTNRAARTSLLDDPAYAANLNMPLWLDSLKGKNLKSVPHATWRQEYNTEITFAVDPVFSQTCVLHLPAASALPQDSQRSAGRRSSRWCVGTSHLPKCRPVALPPCTRNDRPLCLRWRMDQLPESASLSQRSQDVYPVDLALQLLFKSTEANGDHW